MSFLSPENINQVAPYKVTRVDDMSVSFVTLDGVRYLIGFFHDIFVVDKDGYYLYVVDQDTPQRKDPLVAQTIIAIIEDFFNHVSRSAVLYICDVNDKKQALRARLFSGWFNTADDNSKYTLNTYQNQDDKGVVYYYGLILRRDNPEHDEIVQIFYDFLAEH